jgi:hypothetical protein
LHGCFDKEDIVEVLKSAKVQKDLQVRGETGAARSGTTQTEKVNYGVI